MPITSLLIIFALSLLPVSPVWGQSADPLSSSSETEISVPANRVTVEKEEAAGPPLETEVYQLKFLRPSEIADKVREVMGAAPGGVIVNDQTRELEVTAAVEIREKVAVLIDSLDQERKIVLEAKPVRVDLNNEHHPGIKWDAIVSEHKAFIPFDDDRSFSIGTISREDYEVLMEALETVGTTKEFPVQSMTSGNGQDSDLRLKAFEKDLSLTFTPLKMSSSSGYDEPQDRYTARLLITATALGDQEVDLRIMLTDGKYLSVRVPKDHIAVIGGIFTQSKAESTTKFPFLGDLPVFGVVFRDQSLIIHRMENIIFLTPRAVSATAVPEN